MSIDQSLPGVTLTDIIHEVRQLRAEFAAFRERPVAPETRRTYYNTGEFAKLVKRSDFTVRQWCNRGQINAVKRIEKRGGSALWGIASDELDRYRNEGLLPMDLQRNNTN